MWDKPEDDDPTQNFVPVDSPADLKKKEAVRNYYSDQARKARDEANQKIKDAQDNQDIGTYTDTIGKLLTNYGNSQKQPIYLANRLQDLGRPHDAIQPEKQKWGGVQPYFDKKVEQAKDNKANALKDIQTDAAMQSLDDQRYDAGIQRDLNAKQNDPNSGASQRAQLLARSGLNAKAKEAEQAGDKAAANALRNMDVSGMTSAQAMDFYKGLSQTDYKDVLNNQAADKRLKYQADRADQLQARQEKLQSDKQYSDVQHQLEQTRGNPSVQQAEKDLYAADKADSLANIYGDPNKLSPAQVQLLASEVGKIAAGGVPTQHELDGLTPDTVNGKLAKIKERFLNEPTAANAGEFVKQYQDYTKALRKDAQKVVNDRYGRILDSNRGRLSDEGYQTLQDQYLNRFEQPETATPAPQQTQKPAWAK